MSRVPYPPRPMGIPPRPPMGRPYPPHPPMVPGHFSRRTGDQLPGRSDRHSLVGSSSYGHEEDCCPLVVDPLTLIGLLGGIAAATAFLNVLITMNITGRKRKRRSVGNAAGAFDPGNAFLDVLHQGKERALNRIKVTTTYTS